jgi:Protein of unknown function (DUF2796)
MPALNNSIGELKMKVVLYRVLNSILICVFGLVPIFALAHEPGAHVHGVASLQVAAEDKTLTMNFSSPLDNLIGFEHKAHNQAEVDKVQSMINQFYKKPAFFVPTKTAECQIKTIHLDSLVIKKTPADAAKKPEHEEEPSHADLDGEFIFTCNHPENMRDLQVNLFKIFPNLHQLNVEVVSAKGQTAAKLTPENNQISW